MFVFFFFCNFIFILFNTRLQLFHITQTKRWPKNFIRKSHYSLQEIRIYTFILYIYFQRGLSLRSENLKYSKAMWICVLCGRVCVCVCFSLFILSKPYRTCIYFRLVFHVFHISFFCVCVRCFGIVGIIRCFRTCNNVSLFYSLLFFGGCEFLSVLRCDFGVKVKECAGEEKTSKHVRERNETPQREGSNKKKI